MYLRSLQSFALTCSCVINALRITNFSVPQKADHGSMVTLRCDFELENEKLNSLKWYKDEVEFYRYIPRENSEKQVFPQIGITVDEKHSDLNKVILRNLTFKSNGKYDCEVSSDRPSFQTDTMSGNLTVYAYSPYDPHIAGFATSYLPGELIQANCSAGPSNPPPQIEWFINEEEAAHNHLITYATTYLPNGMFHKVVGLRFIAMENDFRPPRNTITFQCKVTVGVMEPWNALKIIHRTLQPYQIGQRFTADETATNHSSGVHGLQGIIFIIIISIMTLFPLK
ncbi:hypothetical protein LSTR_LSTR014041 [Laodelphax striatellus]|uniref:Ig-like domain-containing protein n=1 Tax=Laodelphax striatellus TaxID=195883 RepID=A0A482X4Y9_LAOST|nr:hypothetical protein LSTR_LSTR014041 [Laodelphax striatellus]